MEVVPQMPDEAGMPEEFRDLRKPRWKLFVWNYVFNGAVGSAAARAAGYSDSSEACKVKAHGLLQREDVNAAIRALCTKFLFSLAPKALMRLDAMLDDPKHPKHVKAIELTLDRSGHAAKTSLEVNVTGRIEVNHIDAALEDLASMIRLGVPREKLEETFGYSGLARYERMLAERDGKAARRPALIEGEVVKE